MLVYVRNIEQHSITAIIIHLLNVIVLLEGYDYTILYKDFNFFNHSFTTPALRMYPAYRGTLLIKYI